MLRTTALIVAATASVSFAQIFQASATWDTAAGGNGHTYTVFWAPNGITFEDAEVRAEMLSGTLATITSDQENLFVTSSLNLLANANLWYVDGFNNAIGPWIGGIQQPGASEPGGGWTWITGETWEYSNWSSGEPNNSGGTENRAHYFGAGPTPNVTWNDITNSVLIQGYVVEIVPTPGTIALACIGGLLLTRRRR